MKFVCLIYNKLRCPMIAVTLGHVVASFWVELPTMVVDDMIGCVLLFKNGVEVPCVVDECLTGSTCALFSMKKALAPEDTRS
jgi:hypothetical protein